MLRVVYPTVSAMGFGNNVIALAKAHLIAESCAMTYQRPIWPPTEHVPGERRGYGHYLQWTGWDRLRVAIFSHLSRLQRKFSVPPWPPCVSFRREDYAEAGQTDVGEACRLHLRRRGLDDPGRSVIVTTSGMWGGYPGISRARPWIRQLLLSHADTRRRYESIDRAIGDRFRIGVNIRMGDFLAPGEHNPDRQGERLVRLPLEWFAQLCRLMRSLVDCEIVLVTDGTREELAEFLAEFRPVHTIDQPFTAFLGVLLLSRCDLVVCSNSTYSRLACFLSDRPYVWFADTLFRDPSGRYGYLWKGSVTARPPSSNMAPPVTDGSREAIRRCFALSADFVAIPEGLRRYVASGGRAPIEIENDLLYRDPVLLQ